jgi:hypothetical protein
VETINHGVGEDGYVSNGDRPAGITDYVCRRLARELRGLRNAVGLVIATDEETVAAGTSDVVIDFGDSRVQMCGIGRGK